MTCFYGKNSPSRNDGITILLITEGRTEINLGSRGIIARAGDLILWEHGVPREYRALSGHPLSYYLAIFQPVPATGKNARLSDIGLRPYYRLKHPESLINLFQELSGVFNGRDRLRAQKCSILGMRLLLMLGPEPGFQPRRQDGPDDRPTNERILDSLDYINANYKKRLNVRTLAARAMMHRVHFTRCFKKVTGLSPHRYILEKKIEKARDFVLGYGESLSTTAVELGFHDYAHFYRVCRRIAGKSPPELLEKTVNRKRKR
jgi:AraC-like DNA-binding protein